MSEEAQESLVQEVQAGMAPHVQRATLVKGRDRHMLVVTFHMLHESVVRGIPEEVLAAQSTLIESHEVDLFPSDEFALKRGRAIQKRRLPSEEEAKAAHEELVQAILRGDQR